MQPAVVVRMDVEESQLLDIKDVKKIVSYNSLAVKYSYS